MGWEYRSRGGPYYIRHTTSNGHTVREYLGRGPAAERTAAEDTIKRAVQERDRAEWQQLEALDSDVAALCSVVDVLSQGTLLTEGYHQHHRGEWRKRRA